MAGKLFVFDLDDTLIDNMHDYAEPILDSCRVIIGALRSRAPHVSKIVAMEQEIDTARVKEINPDTGKPFLFSMERFPGSLARTYETTCRGAGIEPDKKISKKIYLIGLGAFNSNKYRLNINSHASRVVGFLSDCGDKVVLLSKGDERVQRNKLLALKSIGINFAETHVVDNKSAEVFRRISASSDCDEFYSVGNSYESDIIPALEVGYRGILIPIETWDVIGKMEAILSKVDRNKCLVLGSLSEIMENYDEL